MKVFHFSLLLPPFGEDVAVHCNKLESQSKDALSQIGWKLLGTYKVHRHLFRFM